MVSDEDDACNCPFCDGGEVPAEIVERIMTSAGQQGTTMTHAEFRVWLNGVGKEGSEPR